MEWECNCDKNNTTTAADEYYYSHMRHITPSVYKLYAISISKVSVDVVD